MDHSPKRFYLHASVSRAGSEWASFGCPSAVILSRDLPVYQRADSVKSKRASSQNAARAPSGCSCKLCTRSLSTRIALLECLMQTARRP